MAQVDGGLHEHPSPQVLMVLVSIICPLLLLLMILVRLATSPAARAAELLSRLPSPPTRLPVIGHLHLVGSLPHVSLRDLAGKHGPDVMFLRLGAAPTLVVSSPRAARAVLRTHDHAFASRPLSAVTDILFYDSSDVAFSPYGDHWRQVKKIVTTHLLTSKKVRSYRLAREQEVRLVVARIADAAGATAGAAVDLSELLNSFANDIVCHAVSGKFLREEGRNELFRKLIETNSVLLGGFNLEDVFPTLARMKVVRRVLCAKAESTKKRWDDMFDKLIDGHATKSVLSTSQHDDEDEESDFIDVLLSIRQEYGLTKDNIKALLVDMFEAGTDTSFIVLEYAMAELIQKPHAMARLQAEVRGSIAKGNEMVTEDDLSSMSYLKCVIKETLRLHPPAPLLLPHLSTAECDIEGYTIPSETRVIINAWALGRDPSSWESAEEFMPERFMEGDGCTMAAVDYKGNDFHFLPFGAGRRVCPGVNFAMATVEIMLANLVYRFDWKLPAGSAGIDMSESFGVTVHRKEKLVLVPKLVDSDGKPYIIAH